MAVNYRALKTGLAREVHLKLVAKFDNAVAARALRWIRHLTPHGSLPDVLKFAVERIPEDIEDVDMKEFHGYLSNGFVLGYLLACLKSPTPTMTAKTWSSSENRLFETSRQRERIALFINFCSEYGVDDIALFQTNELYEQSNLSQVVMCLCQLGLKAQTKSDYKGPKDYWIEKLTKHKRNFNERQLRFGGILLGTNGHTSESEISPGVNTG